MADKDLDALTTDLKKAAVSTVALSVAQLAVKKVTDQLTATVGTFDKQVTKATKDVEDLTSKLDDLFGKLSPVGGALKAVADNLDAVGKLAQSGTVVIIQNADAMGQLGEGSNAAAKGQDAVKEAMKGAGDEAEKNKEKLKKVQETAKELGTSMIDVVSALASGKEPMEVLKDKGAEMAKMLLKAKVDGVNLGETFKTLGVATGLLTVKSTEVAAAQAVQAGAADALRASNEADVVAAGEAAGATQAATAAITEETAAYIALAESATTSTSAQAGQVAVAGETAGATQAATAAITEEAAAYIALAESATTSTSAQAGQVAVAGEAAGATQAATIAISEEAAAYIALAEGATTSIAAQTGQAAAASEAAAANGMFAESALAAIAGQTGLAAATAEGTVAFEAQAVAATEAAAVETVALTPLALLLAGIAVTVGLVAGAFAVAASDISGEVGDLTEGMGLTAEQLDRVKDKSVTMGDVAKATFEVLAKRLNDVFGPSLKAVGEGFLGLYHKVTEVSFKAVAYAVGAFVGAYAAIRASWSLLPGAIGDIVISAVQIVLDGISTMINKAIGLANGMIGLVNGLAEKLGLSLKIPTLGNVDAIKVANQFAGMAKNAGRVANEAFNKEFKTTANGILSIPKEIKERSIGVAEERIAKQAGDPSRTPDYGRANAAIETARAATLETETVSAANEVWADAGEIAAAYAKQQKAKAAAQSAEIKTMDELIGRAIHLSATMEILSIDFQNSIKISNQMSSAVTGIADAVKTQDWVGAFGGLFSLLDQVKKAFDEGQSTAEKFSAVAGLAQGVGKVIGGKTGAAIGSAASGMQAGAQLSSTLGVAGPWGAAIGAALGGLSGVLGGSAAKAQAKLEGLKKGVEDLRTANMASSNSIAGALEEANQNWNSDLEYSNEMLTALRSIDNQIGALAGSLSRSITAGKLMSTTNLALGKTGGGGLFGSSSNTELLDQGLAFNSATYGQVASGGLSGQAYADLATTKTSKFLGVVTGVKVKTSTVNGGLGDDLLGQVSGIIQALGDGVIKAATKFGPSVGEAAKAALDSAQIDIGKLSLKGLSSDEIEKLLNATFSKVGDDLAAAGVPGLEKLADVGEGAFETLIRLAREYEVVDVTLASIGKKFGQLGLESLAARDALVEAVGGLDAFVSKTSFFAQNFLTEAERLKPSIDMVNEGLADYGLSAESSRDAFKNLVLAQNLTTESGQQTYAALLDLAPAFDKVATAAEAAKAAVDDKRTSLQDQIDDLTLSPTAKLAKSRNAEMAAVVALDKSLVPLLETLWGLQDAADAAKLATDRSNMYADLLDAQGRTAEATQRRRILALAAIEDPVQKQYQTQIWAAQDAAEKVSAARDVLSQAYQREQDAIQATKDKFKELSASLRAFSASLTDTIAGTDPGARYRRTREAFLSTAAMARLGDPDAMGRLQSEGEAFTAASRDYVSTSLDYLRDVGLVRSAVDEAADTADRQVSIAQRQLDALDASVRGLIEIKASVVSVEQAILSLRGALGEARAAGVVSVGGSSLGLADPAPSPAGSGSGAPLLTQAQKDYNNAAWNWMLVNSEAGKAGADLTDPVIQSIYASAAHYTPGYMDIVSTQGIEAANALVAAGKLSYTQGGSLKLATGGSFEVGGSGPPDSKLFNLALSPGEAVNVRRRESPADQPLITELRRLREELADLRATNARIATSNDKMERTLTNVTEGGRAMQTQAAA